MQYNYIAVCKACGQAHPHCKDCCIGCRKPCNVRQRCRLNTDEYDPLILESDDACRQIITQAEPGAELDLITLRDALERQPGALDKIGGAAY